MKKIKIIGLFTAALFTAGFAFADDFDFGDDFGSDFGGDFGDSSASFAGGVLEVNGEAQIDFRAYFDDEDEFIVIIYRERESKAMALPCFKEGTMYKGMEVGKEYTLEELGL